MASPLVQEALIEFRRRFCSKFPLEVSHCSQFSDEKDIKKAAHVEKAMVWMELCQKLRDSESIGQDMNSIMNQLAAEIQLQIEELVTKHKRYKADAESLMRGRIQQLRDHFNSSLKEKLLLDKDMDIKTLEHYTEKGTMMAVNHFGSWKHGNIAFYRAQEESLKKELKQVGCEALEKLLRQKCDELSGPPAGEEQIVNNSTSNNVLLNQTETSVTSSSRNIWNAGQPTPGPSRGNIFHRSEKFKCPKMGCNKFFSSTGARVRHQFESHSVATNMPKWYRCPLNGCPIKSKRKSDVDSHFKVHVDPTQFTCQRCGKVFNHIKNVKEHQKICTAPAL